jgi:hypothetical protein
VPISADIYLRIVPFNGGDNFGFITTPGSLINSKCQLFKINNMADKDDPLYNFEENSKSSLCKVLT